MRESATAIAGSASGGTDHGGNGSPVPPPHLREDEPMTDPAAVLRAVTERLPASDTEADGRLRQTLRWASGRLDDGWTQDEVLAAVESGDAVEAQSEAVSPFAVHNTT